MGANILSALFTADRKEVLNAALNAAVAGVVAGLYGFVYKEGFDISSVDWGALGTLMLNWAIAGFIGSFGKTLGTTKEGKFLGVAQVK